MIFFQHARVKFALFFDMICYIWAQGKMGIVAFKLNMFQRIFYLFILFYVFIIAVIKIRTIIVHWYKGVELFED